MAKEDANEAGYVELRNLVYARRYEDARRLVLRFDGEDDPEGPIADEDPQ